MPRWIMTITWLVIIIFSIAFHAWLIISGLIGYVLFIYLIIFIFASYKIRVKED